MVHQDSNIQSEGMAPLGVMDRKTTMNMNNDDAFLSLLSSQRELLNRLNMEGSKKNDQKDNTIVAQGNKRKRGSIIGTSDPLSLMNTPISAHGSSFDMLLSRRLSLTFGGDFFGFPQGDSMYSFVDEEKAKDFDMGPDMRSMKSRRSSLDFYSSMAYEDPHILTNRRFSMLSTLSGYTGLSDGMDQELQSERTPTAPISSLTGVQLDPRIPPEKVRENLGAFAISMDRSTKSQQDIHAWDRKMGLKRSHSKTMRMTMRSRKKLRALLKKDINSLYQSNH